MVFKYNNLARENGVIVVSAVGFDCIPVETLLEYLENHFGGMLSSRYSPILTQIYVYLLFIFRRTQQR